VIAPVPMENLVEEERAAQLDLSRVLGESGAHRLDAGERELVPQLEVGGRLSRIDGRPSIARGDHDERQTGHGQARHFSSPRSAYAAEVPTIMEPLSRGRQPDREVARLLEATGTGATRSFSPCMRYVTDRRAICTRLRLHLTGS
jgi:hypothetical protein